jgi:hypothetical protein
MSGYRTSTRDIYENIKERINEFIESETSGPIYSFDENEGFKIRINILSSRLPANYKIILNDEKTGLYLKRFDEVVDLADMIEKFINSIKEHET